MLERFESFVLCVLHILKSIPAALVRITVSADAASNGPELRPSLAFMRRCAVRPAGHLARLRQCVCYCLCFFYIHWSTCWPAIRAATSFNCFHIVILSVINSHIRLLAACQQLFFFNLLVAYGPTRPPVPASELALTNQGFKDNDQRTDRRIQCALF